MSGQRIFPGMILIGFGLYIFLEQSAILWIKPYLGWPAFLVITGAALLAEGYKSNGSGILPGTVLTGFGIHFYVIDYLGWWANDTGVFILMISLGFLLQHQKAGTGLFHGVLFLTLATVTLFHGTFKSWFSLLELVGQFWPLIFIASGGYLLFVKKTAGKPEKK